ADGLAFQVEKTLKDSGDKIAADKKAPVEAALKDLQEALKNTSTPIDTIKAKQEALMKAMEPVAQEMYASAQAAGAPGADTTGAAGTPPPPQDPPKDDKKGGDDVVDADFTMK
ncbi:MAG: Hsp70 family protein, partial [Kiritimatiellae bacterium]|nr:Hsp70 family protein [Kiritimatiellia bacterium]